MFQLKDRLLQKPKIRKLLYYTSSDALDLEDVSIEKAQDMITLTPIIEDEQGIAESYRNVFIAIYMGDLIPGDTDNDITFRIAAYANKDNYELDNNRIRPLLLMDEIFKEISNVKFEFSGKIYAITVVAENLIRGNFSGFVSTWNVVDGNEII